jgi:NAD(P)-dependent dehydrogenase (short-subunit alcohol dehydrogenase family)
VSARRALVTGASAGIGAATVRLLAREGFRVALLARRAEELEAVRAGLATSADGAHLSLPCDVGDPAAVHAAFAACGAAFGGLELLVNCAGVGYRARVEELDLAVVERLWRTNVTGLFTCCKEALPLLRRGTAPVVVNVASVVGRRGVPGQAAYCASKAAVCSLSESLRLEWAAEGSGGIAVCTLDPGMVATGFFAAEPKTPDLPVPDFTGAASAADVALHVLALARRPRPEVFLRPLWRWLGVLSLVAPRRADRLLAKRLGPPWQAPRR